MVMEITPFVNESAWTTLAHTGILLSLVGALWKVWNESPPRGPRMRPKGPRKPRRKRRRIGKK